MMNLFILITFLQHYQRELITQPKRNFSKIERRNAKYKNMKISMRWLEINNLLLFSREICSAFDDEMNLNPKFY